MELLHGLLTVLEPAHLIWIIIGVTFGTLIGALPGIGPTTTIAILLPVTFGMDPLPALLLIMGIYQGSMFGGRISAILINVPPESTAVATTFDGYPLARKGKAGYALTLSAVASFFGGIFGFIGLVLLSGVMVQLALKFGPPEYFSLILFALLATGGIMEKNWFKPVFSLAIGLLVSTVGVDVVTGDTRLTFGVLEIMDGIDFVVIIIGLFGISEVLKLLEESNSNGSDLEKLQKISYKSLFSDIKKMLLNYASIIRGAIIGFVIGILPGAGPTAATFISYGVEKRISKTPEKFGTGMEEGLSSPEACNNAAEAGTFVPLFSLGIPGSATSAVILGALMMMGLQPGPEMFQNSGDIVWGAIASLLVANILLLILNTAFIPLFTVAVVKIQPFLIPFITVLCITGTYMYSRSMVSVGIMLIFGVFGYFMRKNNFPLAPFVLAIVLGGMLESNLRQSLLISHNNYSIFFTRPISLILMILTILIIIVPIFRKVITYFSKNINSDNS